MAPRRPREQIGARRGATAAKVAIHDIQITKKIDKASPNLFQAAVSGKHFQTAVLTASKAGKTYLTIKLSDVVISSAQDQKSGVNTPPAETLTLNFSKIEYANGK